MTKPERFEATLCAFSTYNRVRDPVDHRMNEVIPDDAVPAHAVDVSGWRPVKETVFLASYEYRTARCGAVVKAYAPVRFKADDPDACPACIAAIERGDPTPKGLRWHERDRDDEPEPVPDELFERLEQWCEEE